MTQKDDPEEKKSSQSRDSISPGDRIAATEKGFDLLRSDWKFLVGLATGALVLSIAFVHQIAPTPRFTWLLVLGWISLLLSILANVEMTRRSLHLVVFLRSVQYLPEQVRMIPLDRYVLAEVLARFSAEVGKEGETLEELGKKYYAKLGESDLGGAYRRLIKIFSRLGKGDRGILAELSKLLVETLRLGKALGRFSGEVSPSTQIKSFRRALLAMHFLTPVSFYGFYAGVFLIALFGMLNLPKAVG